MVDKILVAIDDDNIVLRDPKTKKRVTKEGILVDKTSFWLRRLKSGEVFLLKQPTKEVEQDGDKL